MTTCPECSKQAPEGSASCPACGFPFGGGASSGSKGSSVPADGKCPACGLLNPPTALVCDCGYDFAADAVRARPGQRHATPGRSRSSGSGGFFSFRTMVSGDLIRFTYVIGMVGMILAALIYVSNVGDAHPLMIAAVLAGMLVAQVFWRLACEGWILLFRIHEVLESIDSKVERRRRAR